MMQKFKDFFKLVTNGGKSISKDIEEDEGMSQNGRNQRTSKESDFVNLLPKKTSSGNDSSKAFERLKESADYGGSAQSPAHKQRILHTIVVDAIVEVSIDNVPLRFHSKHASLKIAPDKKMKLQLSKDVTQDVSFKAFKYFDSRTDEGKPVIIIFSCSMSNKQYVLWTNQKSDWSILKNFAKGSIMDEKDHNKCLQWRRSMEAVASSKPKKSFALSDVFEDIGDNINYRDSESKISKDWDDDTGFVSRLRDSKGAQPMTKINKRTRRSQKDVRRGAMDSHVVYDLSNADSDGGESDTEDIPTPPRGSSSKGGQISKTLISQNPFAENGGQSKYYLPSKPAQNTNISPLSASLPSSRSQVRQFRETSGSSLMFNQAFHEDWSEVTYERERSPSVRTYGTQPMQSSSAFNRKNSSSAFSQVSRSQRVTSSSASLGSSSLASLAHALPCTTTTKKEVVDIANEDDEEVTHVPEAKAASLQRDSSLRTERNRILLTYPSGTLDSVTITVGDMDKLSNEAFINDSLLDFYMKYLQLDHLQTDYNGTATSKVHVFTSFLYSRLVDLVAKSTGVLSKQFGREPTAAESWLHAYSQLWRWTAGVSLFEKTVIVFPINSGLHWSLAACVMTLDDNPDNCRGLVLTFDSMARSSHDPEAIAKTIRRYLDHEYHFRLYLGSEPKARAVKSSKVSVKADEEEDDDFEPEVVDSSTVSRKDDIGIANLYDEKVAEIFTAKKFPLQRVKVAEQKDGFNCGLHLLKNFLLLLHQIDLLGDNPDYAMFADEDSSLFADFQFTTAQANEMRETIRKVVLDEIQKQNACEKNSSSSSSSPTVAAGSSSSSAIATGTASVDPLAASSNVSHKSLKASTSSLKISSNEANRTNEKVIETQDDDEEAAVDHHKRSESTAKSVNHQSERINSEEKGSAHVKMIDSSKNNIEEMDERDEEKVAKSLAENESRASEQVISTKSLEMADSTGDGNVKEETPNKAYDDKAKIRSGIKQTLPNVSAAQKEDEKEIKPEDVEGSNDSAIPSPVDLSFRSQIALNAARSSASKRLRRMEEVEDQTEPVPFLVDDIPKQEEKEFTLPIDDDGFA